MKRYSWYLCFILTILVSACLPEEGEKTITIEKRYSLTIPSFLSETTALNDEASLQYQNMLKEFYVVVIDEPKSELQKVLTTYDLTNMYEDNVDGYTNLILNNLYEGLDKPIQTEVVETNVNGLPTRFTTMNGSINGIDIFYTYGIYEGYDTYYQVIVWTLSDRQVKHQSKMDAILESFEELNKGGKNKKPFKKGSKPKELI